MKPLLILLNGDLGDAAAVKRLAKTAEAVVAADGGARHAIALGVQPRIVIGDMDSLPRKRPAWPGTVYLCDFDPERSDFEKALRFAGRQGFARAAKRSLGPARAPAERLAEVLVAGAAGGRLDHTLANLAVAERYAEAFDLRLVGGIEGRVLATGTHRVKARRGARVSLLPVGGPARLTTRGLRWPLRDEPLERGSRGLSNEATSASFTVRVHDGRAWLLWS